MKQIMDYYPLTHPQKGRWYIEKFYPGTSINNIGATLILQGEIDYVLLNKAINNFIQRNDGIRLRMAEDLGEPRQYVSDYRPIEFELIDFSDSYDPEVLAAWCTKEINKPFQLINHDLFYFALVKISENEGGAFVKFHHLISDAWTMTLLGNQVMQCYFSLVKGEDIETAIMPSYLKYLAIEDEYTISKRFEKARQFWNEQFSDLPELATFKPRTSFYTNTEAKRITLELSVEETDLIQQYCKQERQSVFIVMYSALAAYVSNVTGIDDIVIATMVLNRYSLEEKLTAGMFANVVPIRAVVDGNLKFDDLCHRNKINWKPILKSQRYPYDLLFKDIMAKHKTNGKLYDILLSYQNAKLIRENSVEGYKTQWIFNGHVTDPFVMHVSDRDDEGQLTIEYDYQIELFKEEEIFEIHNDLMNLLFNAIQNPEKRISELDQQYTFNYLPIPKDPKEELTLRITSTFTAEPIEDYITWWGRQFGYDLNVEFAAYNQVFQELLDPYSKLSANTEGINVILARFEDYIRDDHGAESDKLSKLEQVFAEFIQAIVQYPNKAPLIIGQFPVSTHLGLSLSVQNKIDELNLRLAEALASYRNIYLLDLTQLQDIYSIEEAFDSLKDKEGHMPFRDEFYAAMGTEITRKICAIKKQAFKVIVLDCDETLWQGICGEEGAAGVTVTAGHKEFQQFLLQKQREGFLLAICSKNNEADVWEVFEKNHGMVLEKKHITAWQINWQEKNQNIRELADDLNLGIDSFIFIDDSPVECTKMVEAYPEVLTLLMPTQEEIIPIFLKHVWAFDRVKVTKEDAQRASMYEAEQKRKQVETGTSIDDFIKNLELKVSMRSLEDEEIERAAQLTQRTNQFNLSTIRRMEEEIIQMTRDEKYKCFILEAADRFGDYGIIGLVILENQEDKIFIDTFLLSCRVLGRRVEDVVLSGIRRYAVEQGINMVEALYIANAKNQPILEFIEKGKWTTADKNNSSILYEIESLNLPEKIEHIAFYYEESYETIEQQDNIIKAITALGLDHVAIAVENQQQAGIYYEKLGYCQTKAVFDPLQNSQLSIYHSSEFIPIELVAPFNEASPTYNLVKRAQEIPYHLCYQVNSIKDFVELLSDIDYLVISTEKPAVLFNNQPVAFLMINKVGLIELVEVQADIQPKPNYERNRIKLVVQDIEKAITFYKLLGYMEERVTNNLQNNVIHVSLIGLYGERLELLSPKDKESREYVYLSQNGAGVYEIGYGFKETDSNNSHPILNKHYNMLYEIVESKADIKDMVLLDLAALEQSKHNVYLLPLKNSTATKLMQLPIYQGVTYQKHEYIAPRNEMEEKLITIWEDVLKVGGIGIEDNFFELGGNSLRAVYLIAQIHKEFNVQLTPRDIFQKPTVKGLAQIIGNSNTYKYDSIEPIPEQEFYPLSSAQKRMYILTLIDQESTNYNECHQLLINGNLDKDRLYNALNHLVERHEALRTGFIVRDGEPKQFILDNVHLDIPLVKASMDDVDDIKRTFDIPFNLGRPPLFRTMLIEVNADRHILLLDIHHIIIDGTSFGILFRDLLNLYKGKNLGQLNVQYKDFASWQNNLFASDELIMQEEYWTAQFRDEIPVLNLPLDFGRPAMQSYEGKRQYCVLDRSTLNKLQPVCEKTETTLFMMLFTAYCILLYRYSGQEDIVVGTPVAGRRHADVEDMVGVFMNTLPIRTYPNGESTFLSYLNEVKEIILQAMENQDYQYEQLIQKLNIPRDLSRNPLYDVMFILQNMDMPKMSVDGITFHPSKIENNKSKLDMTVSAIEKAEGIEFEFEYCTYLFSDSTIERFKKHYIKLLTDIANHPNRIISDLDILNETEKNQLLYEFNDTYAEYAKEKTIHQLFEEQVEKTPEKTALIFEDKKLSYRELNQKANQLARQLRDKGTGPNQIVGIMVDRSLEMIIGLLAIMKAGGAYLPIDPDYPQERIEYMLDDSAASVLLTQEQLKDFINYAGEVVIIDDEKVYTGDYNDLEYISQANNLIYVIYTSGSTGKPKGVMLEHRNVHNFIVGMKKVIDFAAAKTVLSVTTIAFDIFVTESWLPLTQGMTVVIANENEQMFPEAFNDAILRNHVDIVQTTPSRYKMLLEGQNAMEWIETVSEIIVGGESIPETLLSSLKAKSKGKIYNIYGPTETTVWSTVRDSTNSEQIDIGKPIANTQIYILDQNLRPVPVGVAGELCISGDGVARGYLNREELTAERFVTNPFIPGVRIYRTGDLAKWKADGSIVHLGRIDNQIKIRGYRIELGEIESIITSYPGIKETVVIDREDTEGNKYLCAFIVAADEIPDYEIRQQLLKSMPDYMVPSYFINIETIPITPNGKVDRKALPELEEIKFNCQGYVAPNNNIEEIITLFWQEVLGVEKIGIKDNIFAYGGDSLKVLRFLAKTLPYDWHLTARDVFNRPTVEMLSNYILGLEDKDVIIDSSMKIYSPLKQPEEPHDMNKIEWRRVLLTGATGFLGSHILNHLLRNTKTEVICLIRGKTPGQAKDRLVSTMQIYFPDYPSNDFNERVQVINGDVTDMGLGLDDESYENLGKALDAVIHVAAIVKHYGRYDEFKHVNVQGTHNIIDFCMHHHVRLNYISTMSVAGNAYGLDKYVPRCIFTENDFYMGQNYSGNVYIRSKFEAENLCYQYVNLGLDVCVLRVGMITGRHSDGQFQTNIEDHALYSRIKTIIDIGIVPAYVLEQMVEFTSVDLCSQAVVGLSKLTEASGKVFHVFNHHVLSLEEIIKVIRYYGYEVAVIDASAFKQKLIELAKQDNTDSSFLTIVDDFGYGRGHISYATSIVPDSQITQLYLEKIGFIWPKLNSEYIIKIISYMEQVGFIHKLNLQTEE